MIDAIVAEFGGLQILYNNAGIMCAGRRRHVRPRHLDASVAVNVTGPFLCAKHRSRI